MSSSRRYSSSRRSASRRNPLARERSRSSRDRVMELMAEAITQLKITNLDTRRVALKTEARVDELAKRVADLEEHRCVPRYYAEQPAHHLFVRRSPTPPYSQSSVSSIFSGNGRVESRASADVERNDRLRLLSRKSRVVPGQYFDQPKELSSPRHLFVKPMPHRPSSIEPRASSSVPFGNARVEPRVRKADLEINGLNRYVCPKCGLGYASSYVLTHVKRCKAGGHS